MVVHTFPILLVCAVVASKGLLDRRNPTNNGEYLMSDIMMFIPNWYVYIFVWGFAIIWVWFCEKVSEKVNVGSFVFSHCNFIHFSVMTFISISRAQVFSGIENFHSHFLLRSDVRTQQCTRCQIGKHTVTDKPPTSYFYSYVCKDCIDVTFSYTITLKFLRQKHRHACVGSLFPVPLGSLKWTYAT